MKIATYRQGESLKVGVVVDDRVYDLAAALAQTGGDTSFAASTIAFLSAGDQAVSAAQKAINQVGEAAASPLNAVKLAAPLPCPGKLLCLAGNYAAHIQEGGGVYVG